LMEQKARKVRPVLVEVMRYLCQDSNEACIHSVVRLHLRREIGEGPFCVFFFFYFSPKLYGRWSSSSVLHTAPFSNALKDPPGAADTPDRMETAAQLCISGSAADIFDNHLLELC